MRRKRLLSTRVVCLAFYNDNAFIKILRNMGIAEEDLVDWSPDGCIEASIPGKWDFAAKGPWLNVEKVLEIIFKQRRRSGNRASLKADRQKDRRLQFYGRESLMNTKRCSNTLWI